MSERQIQTLRTWFEETEEHLTAVFKDEQGNLRILDIPIEYSVN